MSDFDTPAADTVVEIRLECISKMAGSDGMWWVAEGLADGGNQPRGVFVDALAAERRAEELAAQHGVPIKRVSHVD